MSRPAYEKGGINPRQRVSLVTEILLEGAMRIMESAEEKQEINESIMTKRRVKASTEVNKESMRIQANPTYARR